MPYTIWSRGRLLGETELDYVRCIRRHRAGDFQPTDFGHTVMPLATEPTVAMLELGKVMRSSQLPAKVARMRRSPRSADPAWATAQADLASAIDRREGLALELRGPTGAVIPTEWIDIRDTEFLIALAEEEMEREAEREMFEHLDPEIEAAVEHDLAVLEEQGFFDEEPWRGNDPVYERPPARYQIQVCLLDDRSVP